VAISLSKKMEKEEESKDLNVSLVYIIFRTKETKE
jgi:hypothetical protein